MNTTRIVLFNDTQTENMDAALSKNKSIRLEKKEIEKETTTFIIEYENPFDLFMLGWDFAGEKKRRENNF